MYKSSGKKYKGSSAQQQQQQQQYRVSGYNSDVYRSDEDDDDSLYDSINASPDYYSGSGKNSNSFYQSSGKPGLNDRYYSTPSYSTRNNNMGQYNSGYSNNSKHKGKDAYKLNKYQTIVLKIQIHCEACIKKVKKAIAKIDGVESISVDHKLKRVSVTGYIDPKKVLKKVANTGKSVELIGGTSMPKDSLQQAAHHLLMSNKQLSNLMAPEHQMIRQHQAMNNISSLKNPGYNTVLSQNQVEKSSRSNVHNVYNAMQHQHHQQIIPHYNNSYPQQQHHQQANFQLRSDVEHLFNDDNAHSCSIM